MTGVNILALTGSTLLSNWLGYMARAPSTGILVRFEGECKQPPQRRGNQRCPYTTDGKLLRGCCYALSLKDRFSLLPCPVGPRLQLLGIRSPPGNLGAWKDQKGAAKYTSGNSFFDLAKEWQNTFRNGRLGCIARVGTLRTRLQSWVKSYYAVYRTCGNIARLTD